MKNVRFKSLWAGENFQVSEEPTSYRFIPVPGGLFFLFVFGFQLFYFYPMSAMHSISPENKSAPPRVAQDSSSVGLDVPMVRNALCSLHICHDRSRFQPTAVLDETNPFQMWELIPQ
jgi:hypothetical protein